MKGIILAGGSGTRVYPSTKVVSKQLLPIYDKPTIYYPLSTLIKLGIKDIMIITNGLAYNHILDLLGKKYLGINFEFRIQKKPGGIAEALVIAEEWQGDDDVCLILGDNIFTGINKTPWPVEYGACITGYKVKDPHQYGVVCVKENKLTKISEIISIEEKPKHTNSNLAVTGIYFYDNTAGERALALKPSDRGELEITDLNLSYLDEGTLWFNEHESKYAWFDTGNPDEMFAATMFIKSIQDRTNCMVGCIEYESYNAGNITQSQFEKIVNDMPECSYKQKIKQSYF
jgi:glucose-1-phosphate thymidylyltransferase|tara:strand:+ start:171 stop:1031 length:861 start_codon:yes stop_codon:yes gene_type:complete